ncbi:MAG: Hsp70 family protein [Planctomycetes bacterium]|nr:Hsp70 family protein [Planctomycetota bacterium]
MELSDQPVAIARKAELVPDKHLSLEEEIDRASFEREIMPLVVKSGQAIDEALSLKGMRPKDIDKILLVGGTSKIPLIRRFVSEKLAGKEA